MKDKKTFHKASENFRDGPDIELSDILCTTSKE